MQIELWPAPADLIEIADRRIVHINVYFRPELVLEPQCYEIDAADFRYLRRFRCCRQYEYGCRDRRRVQHEFEWRHVRGLVSKGEAPWARPDYDNGWRIWSGCPDCVAVLRGEAACGSK